MRKPDEIELYAAVRHLRVQPYEAGRELPDATAARLGIAEKRGYCLLQKWADKGWWDYGVSLRCGWFTPDAPEVLTP